MPRLAKPLRPLWITPSSSTLPNLTNDLDFFPIICLSASRQVEDGLERGNGYCYVQGSGDDHESWAHGLTPEIFWEHRNDIQTASPEYIEAVVDRLVNTQPGASSISRTPIARVQDRVQIGTFISISPNSRLASQAILVVDEELQVEGALVLRVPSSKAGQLQFMTAIPKALAAAEELLEKGEVVRIASKGSLDMAIVMAMAVLQRFFDDEGQHLDNRSAYLYQGC